MRKGTGANMQDDEAYQITPEGILIALKAEAYTRLGYSLDEILEKLEIGKEELQVLLVMTPDNITIEALDRTPEEIIGESL